MDTVGEDSSGRATVYRWRSAFQNEFQARMDWCHLPRGQANHPPEVRVLTDIPRTKDALWVEAGIPLLLDARGSKDPDGDQLIFHWFVYQEAGSYTGTLPLAEPGNAVQRITPPRSALGHSIHLILEVRDSGSPALSRYERLVLRVKD